MERIRDLHGHERMSGWRSVGAWAFVARLKSNVISPSRKQGYRVSVQRFWKASKLIVFFSYGCNEKNTLTACAWESRDGDVSAA
jgi:hypothetical protein